MAIETIMLFIPSYILERRYWIADKLAKLRAITRFFTYLHAFNRFICAKSLCFVCISLGIELFIFACFIELITIVYAEAIRDTTTNIRITMTTKDFS